MRLNYLNFDTRTKYFDDAMQIMGVSKKIGIAVAIVAIAVGIGLASPLFYEVDIDEPIPTGSIIESAEMMEKLADSVIDSATEEMMDISLADMKEMPMLEKAIGMMDAQRNLVHRFNGKHDVRFVQTVG